MATAYWQRCSPARNRQPMTVKIIGQRYQTIAIGGAVGILSPRLISIHGGTAHRQRHYCHDTRVGIKIMSNRQAVYIIKQSGANTWDNGAGAVNVMMSAAVLIYGWPWRQHGEIDNTNTSSFIGERSRIRYLLASPDDNTGATARRWSARAP